ncbi:glycoside hydrolase family 43 protein [Marispirochaeta sp.]|uniref:glycoside hydrolase family 43 protein n=1 Tax=Marispirochaeta sp. TaxID=2038653 RepID=UPI0029C6D23D|nr:glycoside hydrolase family 43 protein [Marispirochaeta sp.]
MIQNPILPGFHPDPSILRVGYDYYIATSTFEWFPGVEIRHSRDLKHWELIGRPLDRRSQIDMSGNPDSGGVWAPDISFHHGTYYLVYTDVKHHSGIFRDTHNYLVTAPSITGPWSEPFYLNSTGFDPSLFFDDDGKTYLLNMTNDCRPWNNRFSGISLQEFSLQNMKLTGRQQIIFPGTELGFTEGPHLYRLNGYYYLMTAEGGTSYNHAVSMARSASIRGPYEVDPENPVLSSRDNPELELQRAGHADIVQTQNGDWYMVHLCGRPLPGTKNCILGRETAIQKVVWNKSGWLRLAEGGRVPRVEVEETGLPEWIPDATEPDRDDFDSPAIGSRYQTLRVPLGDGIVSLTERPGYLRLRGQESLSSLFRQSLIACRIRDFNCLAETLVEYSPYSFRQMAGLICYYDTMRYHYLYITHSESAGRILSIQSCEGGTYRFPLRESKASEGFIGIPGEGPVGLRVEIDGESLRFFYRHDSDSWQNIGPILDSRVLSDEYMQRNSFTGSFAGVCCQDLSGELLHADFDYFEYRRTKQD